MIEFIITCQSELQKDGSYKIERYRELVRCENCKFWNNNGIITKCEKHIGNGYPANWFCADGKRRVDNA